MTGSLEDYIETIYFLAGEQGVVRVKDISERLGVSKPSVIQALKNLAHHGMIYQKRYGYVYLTEEGKATASSIGRRHHILCEFLTAIGVSREKAEEDACRMEHVVSAETMKAIEIFVSKCKGGKDDSNLG